LAADDYDSNGDVDVLVSNNGGAPQLLRNDGGNASHWLEILLVGTRSNRDGVGAQDSRHILMAFAFVDQLADAPNLFTCELRVPNPRATALARAMRLGR
jgi:hypothetical protein